MQTVKIFESVMKRDDKDHLDYKYSHKYGKEKFTIFELQNMLIQEEFLTSEIAIDYSYNFFNRIEKIEKQFKKVEKLKYDEMTWKTLTVKDFLSYPNITIRDVTKIFPIGIIQKLEEHFKNKTTFNLSYDTLRRDYSVNGRLIMNEDNTIREYCVWFNAEFVGMGNGKYYVLINPYTAVFIEDD